MARKRSNTINLAGIAAKTGLSVSTVSRAMRGEGGIHESTRTRVIELAHSLGYDATQRRNLDIEGKPRHIMVLVQGSGPFNDQRYLGGISKASVTLNLAILSHHVPFGGCGELLEVKSQPASLRAGLVDGLVFVHRWPFKVAAQLSKQWPSVSIVHEYPDTLIDHIGINDRSGVALLIRHLSDTGHTKVGFFGFCHEMTWSASRMGAFVEALRLQGLVYNPRDVIEISLEEALSPSFTAAGAWTASVMNSLKMGVNAWVCASSGAGYSLCRYFIEQGIRMPDDVAVVSCHGGSSVPPPQLPRISTTEIVDEELGSAALRRLSHRFENSRESRRSILFESRFIQGETTRDPKNVQK